MLTLTRKPGETIRIGDDIEIVVKDIRSGAVRIGIQAPQDVFIARGELYRKMYPTTPEDPDTADGSDRP